MNKIKPATILITIAFLCVLIAYVFSYRSNDFKAIEPYLILLVSIIGGVVGILTISTEIGKTAKKNEAAITSQVNILQENIEADFFNKLIKINFKYIEKYYLQTQIQANKSFTVAVAAAIFAFGIIVAGVYLMFTGKTDSAYVATGSGLLSEFISAVFFYLYNKTIIKMGEYHHKLVLTQNISLALKISEQLQGDEKAKIQTQIVGELMKDINSHIANQANK